VARRSGSGFPLSNSPPATAKSPIELADKHDLQVRAMRIANAKLREQLTAGHVTDLPALSLRGSRAN
jgi:hypothetical protein